MFRIVLLFLTFKQKCAPYWVFAKLLINVVISENMLISKGEDSQKQIAQHAKSQ